MTKKDRVEELIGTLVSARKERGISQAELARRTGIKQGNLSRIENLQGDPLTGNLLELARALGFELMLVPKQYVPAVSAIISDVNEDADMPAYALSPDPEDL